MTREQWLKLSAALSAGLLLPESLRANIPIEEILRRSDFGKDFVWGTATASYQIEGGWNEDGKGESNWDHFTHHSHKIKDHTNGDVSDDFYHRYADDIKLMQDMHIPAFRFSLSWPRIMPDGDSRVNEKGLDFYKRVIDECLNRNVEPWVTCFHWDMPQTLEAKGGWMNRNTLDRFEEYVNVVSKALGDRVKNWMVLNEPLSYTVGGYLVGQHPPGKFGLETFYKAVHHVTLSQSAGARAIRRNTRGANIGTTFSCMPVDAWHDTEANKAAAKRIDVMANRLFIEPSLGMGYPMKDLPALHHMEKYMWPGDDQLLAFDFDFIGLQNYTRWMVKNFAMMPMVQAIQVPSAKLGNPMNDMGWENNPEAIYRIIKQFSAYKGIKKIYITENGTCTKDQVVDHQIHDAGRLKYIQEYLRYILKAKQEGLPVHGYFIWSFLDNFEWAYGFSKRFGIVGVDYKTQERIVKDSGKWYSDFLSGR